MSILARYKRWSNESLDRDARLSNKHVFTRTWLFASFVVSVASILTDQPQTIPDIIAVLIVNFGLLGPGMATLRVEKVEERRRALVAGGNAAGHPPRDAGRPD